MSRSGNTIAAACLLAAAVHTAQADSITVKDTRHDNVHVTASDSLYYVKLPASGKVLTVQKDEASEVVISPDPLERDRLEQQWRESRAARNSKVEYDPQKYLDVEEEPTPDTVIVPGTLLAPLDQTSASSPERDHRRGIVERVVEVEKDGSKAIRLRGRDVANRQVQQAQVQMLVEREVAQQQALEEARARQEEEAQRAQQQQAEREQRYLQAMQLQNQGTTFNGPYQVGGVTVIPSQQPIIAGPAYQNFYYGFPYGYRSIWSRIPHTPHRPTPPDTDKPAPVDEGAGMKPPAERGGGATTGQAPSEVPPSPADPATAPQ